MIGPRIKQDLVFAVVGHTDNGMAGGKAAVLDAADIDPGIAHLGAKPFILGIGRSDMAHIAAGAGQRNRLVRTLAAKHPFVVARRQRLSRGRKMRDPIDQIDIDGTKVEDCHCRGQMMCIGPANCTSVEIRAILRPVQHFPAFCDGVTHPWQPSPAPAR